MKIYLYAVFALNLFFVASCTENDQNKSAPRIEVPYQLSNGQAATVPTIEISTTAPQKLNAGFSGYNTRSDMTPARYDNGDFRSMTKALHPGVLRWPAGTMDDFFDWETGKVGTEKKFAGGWSMLDIFAKLYPQDYLDKPSSLVSPVLVAKGANPLCESVPTFVSAQITPCASNSFVDFATKLSGGVGAKKILIVINTFTDSPESARKLAQYVALKNIPVAAFSLGNEPEDVHPTALTDLPVALQAEVPKFPSDKVLPAWIRDVLPQGATADHSAAFNQSLQYLTRMKAYAEKIRQGYAEGCLAAQRSCARDDAVVALAAGFVGSHFSTVDFNRAKEHYVNAAAANHELDSGRYWDAIDLHHYGATAERPKIDLNGEVVKDAFGKVSKVSGDFSASLPFANYVLNDNTASLLEKISAQNWAKGKKIIVSEFDVSLDNKNMKTTFFSGIFAAEYVMRLSKVPELLHVTQHVLTGGPGINAPDNSLGTSHWKKTLGDIGSSDPLTGKLASEFDYSNHPPTGLYYAAGAYGFALANEAINVSDAVYPTEIKADQAFTVSAHGDGEAGCQGSACLVPDHQVSAAFAQAYRGAKHQIHLLITNKGVSPINFALKLDGQSIGNFSYKTVSSATLTNPPVQALVGAPALQLNSDCRPTDPPGCTTVKAQDLGLFIPLGQNPGSKSITVAGYSVTHVVIEPKLATISAMPNNPTSLVMGSSGSLSVQVGGGFPAPQLQWFHNGVAIEGATNATFKIDPVTVGDAGTYSVQATNAAGTASVQFNVAVAESPTTFACNAKEFQLLDFNALRGVRTRWETLLSAPDDRFTLQPNLGGRYLGVWMRSLEVENVNANMGELNLDPSRLLLSAGSELADTDCANVDANKATCPSEWKAYKVALYNTNLQTSDVYKKVRGKVSRYEYTSAQRNNLLIDFLDHMENYKKRCRFKGTIQFLVHQRLWLRDPSFKTPLGKYFYPHDQQGVLIKKSFDKMRSTDVESFANDMSDFINLAKDHKNSKGVREPLDHWLAGVRLGENSNKDMQDFLPLLVNLATKINQKTISNEYPIGWLTQRMFLANGGGWGSYYRNIESVKDGQGKQYAFFKNMAAQTAAFSFGYKWMDNDVEHSLKSISLSMLLASCFAEPATATTPVQEVLKLSDQGENMPNYNNSCVKSVMNPANSIEFDQSVEKWKTFLGDAHGFRALRRFVNAGTKAFPKHANVIFVGDSSDALGSNMVSLNTLVGEQEVLADQPALRALREMFNYAHDEAKTGWSGKLFMLSSNTVGDDPKTLADEGRALYRVSAPNVPAILQTKSLNYWSNWGRWNMP